MISDVKKDVEPAVASAKAEVTELQQNATRIRNEQGSLQADLARYKSVNQTIGTLQRELAVVKGQVVDLGNRDVKARKLITTGSEVSSISFSNLAGVY